MVLYFINSLFSPFVPNAPFLYPLKTSENLAVFWCFQGVEKGCIVNEWVKRKLMYKSKQVSIKISKISKFSFTFKLNEKKKVPLKMIWRGGGVTGKYLLEGVEKIREGSCDPQINYGYKIKVDVK